MGTSDAARWSRALDLLAGTVEARGVQGWIAGGCLRDALLGRPVRDVDVVLTGDPLAFVRSLPGANAAYLAPLSRDAVRLGLRVDPDDDPLQLDLSPLQPPSVTGRPHDASGDTPDEALVANLSRRDFRINAMALPLAARRELVALLAGAGTRAPSALPLPAPQHLMDPLHGYADLGRRIVEVASDTALADDPGRIVRAARLVASHGFALSPALVRQAHRNASRLPVVPTDRLREEVSLLLVLPRAAAGISALDEMGALRLLFPGLGISALAAHALAALRAVEGLQEDGAPDAVMEPVASLEELRAWYASPLRPDVSRITALRWALLVHTAAPHAADANAGSEPTAPSALGLNAVLRVPLAGIDQRIVAAVWTCPAWRARLAECMPSDAALRHLFAAQRGAAVDTLVAAAACNAALAAAPLPGVCVSPHVAERARAILAVYFTDRARLDPPRLLTGADLIAELSLPAGPALGEALRQIREAQLDGTLTTREGALALARQLRQLSAES